MRTLGLVAICLFVLGSRVAAEEPVAGQPMPELRLPTIERDKTISLHSLRGKKVLLIEFASW